MLCWTALTGLYSWVLSFAFSFWCKEWGFQILIYWWTPNYDKVICCTKVRPLGFMLLANTHGWWACRFILVAENLDYQVLPTWQQTIKWLMPKVLLTLLTQATQLSRVLLSLWLLETLIVYGCHSLWEILCCKIRYS